MYCAHTEIIVLFSLMNEQTNSHHCCFSFRMTNLHRHQAILTDERNVIAHRKFEVQAWT